jgi:group I intron endonuclease
MGSVYKTINLINNKIYIGKEKYSSNTYLGSGKILKLAIKKYGKDSFKKEILETCSDDIIDDREKYWINFYKSTNHTIGYNITIGGTGGDTFSNLSDIEKEKMIEKVRKSSLGRKHKPETIKLLKQVCGKALIERKQSKEEIEKRSISLQGKPSNRKGKFLSEESKLKIKNNNTKYWLGRHHSEETKEKLRQCRLKQKMEYRYASYILYDAYDNKIEIINISKFLKDNNFSRTQFYRLINGDRKEYKGFYYKK